MLRYINLQIAHGFHRRASNKTLAAAFTSQHLVTVPPMNSTVSRS